MLGRFLNFEIQQNEGKIIIFMSKKLLEEKKNASAFIFSTVYNVICNRHLRVTRMTI